MNDLDRPQGDDPEDTYRGVPRCPECGAADYQEHADSCQADESEDD